MNCHKTLLKFQLTVSKLDTIKFDAKRYLLDAKNYTDFAPLNQRKRDANLNKEMRTLRTEIERNWWCETKQYTIITQKSLIAEHLDLETVTWDNLIPEKIGGRRTRWHYVEVEQKWVRETQKANKRKDDDWPGKSRVIKNTLIGWTHSRSNEFALKLAEKETPKMRSKKNLDGLCEVLARGLTLIRTKKHTSLIKEAGQKEVTICIFDITKLRI